MKLTKQDVGVWVKASDELPPDRTWLHMKVNDRPFVGYLNPANNMIYNGRQDPPVMHYLKDTKWLKPVKDVYVLTEDELEEIVESEKEIYKQFLESIKRKS